MLSSFATGAFKAFISVVCVFKWNILSSYCWDIICTDCSMPIPLTLVRSSSFLADDRVHSGALTHILCVSVNVYLRMHMHVSLCRCVCTLVCVFLCAHACVCVCIPCLRAFVRGCVRVFVRACIYLCVRARFCVCVCGRVCACVRA